MSGPSVLSGLLIVEELLQTLPAKPHHLAAQCVRLRNIDEVQYHLIITHVARERLENVRVAQPHDEEVRIGDDTLDVFAHERTYMGDMLLDESPVCSEQPRQVHLGVVHEQAQAFANELL